MPQSVKSESAASGFPENSAYELLGGARTIKTPVRNALDMHDVLAKGLPSSALLHMVDCTRLLSLDRGLENAVGISVRTLQRRKKNAPSVLSPEQSSRTWRFAEILSQAIRVLGTKDAAEAWLERPAFGLENRKPLELLSTSAGAETVKTYLERLEYGVYC